MFRFKWVNIPCWQITMVSHKSWFFLWHKNVLRQHSLHHEGNTGMKKKRNTHTLPLPFCIYFSRLCTYRTSKWTQTFTEHSKRFVSFRFVPFRFDSNFIQVFMILMQKFDCTLKGKKNARTITTIQMQAYKINCVCTNYV